MDSGIVVQPRAVNVCAANRELRAQPVGDGGGEQAGTRCDCPDAAWSSSAITDCCGASAIETGGASGAAAQSCLPAGEREKIAAIISGFTHVTTVRPGEPG